MVNNEVFDELLKATGYTQVYDDPFAKDGLIILRDTDGNEKGFDGIELATDFLHGEAEKSTSVMGQAETLINKAEKTQTFLGTSERNLIMNYALHTNDIDKVEILLDKLCMAEFEKEHGFVNPEIETAISKEIETIDKLGIPKYELNLDDSTKYIILEQNKNTALLKRIINEPTTDPTPYIVANGIHFKENNLIEWDSGMIEYSYKAEGIPKKEEIIGEIDFISPDGETSYTEKYIDIDIFEKDIKECLNDGESIEVRDFSKQNIYSNAVVDMCGYDETEEKEKEKWEEKQTQKELQNPVTKLGSKEQETLENLQKNYSATAPIISDNETAVSIFTKLNKNNSVEYEIEYNPFGFNGQENMKFMYIDTLKDTYNTYPSVEDVKEFMDVESYEKFQSIVENNVPNTSLNKNEESWQDKLSHSDKDNDGIPDIIDGTYDPPEYFYRYASPDEIQKLKEKDIDFEFKPKKPCDQYLIKHLKSDCNKINLILQQNNSLQR